jgi:hypothetical protein
MINLCHRFSVIAGVVDTGEKFIVGVNGGRGRLRRPEIVLQQEQTSVINTVYRRWSR